MASIGNYYKKTYDPIHDDYIEEYARLNLESSNIMELIRDGMEITKTPSRTKRVSRYDEDKYALPDEEEEPNWFPPNNYVSWQIRNYYNEGYAPIHDEYMEKQTRINLESRKLMEWTTDGIKISLTSFCMQRVSLYDEDHYAT